jgi:drug/metabolite transporter (DMT)-like permease
VSLALQPREPAHRLAVLAMLGVTTLWSTAGVVARQLQSAASFEVTFWRSFFTIVSVALLLSLQQRGAWLSKLKQPAVWMSGACWAVMFTAFMLAITLTTVANVLVTMSLAPLATALLARVWLKRPLAARTWGAIVLAGAGIAIMYGGDVTQLAGRHGLGTLIALAVPLAAAVNWSLTQGMALRRPDERVDLIPAVFVGAVLSALATLPLALPFAASASDLGWLAFLGLFQLAIPCMLAVWCARHLSAPEVSLLALLEIVQGVLWVWWLAGERPAPAVLAGGGIVLAALAVNEALAWRERRRGAAEGAATASLPRAAP